MAVTAPHPAHLRTRPNARATWTKILLACGAGATLLYAGMDALAAVRYDGYSYTGQTISELSAVDAPTRSLWIPFGAVYGLLVIAGGFGIWRAAGSSRRLRVVAALVAAMGVLALVAWPLAPMHQREVLAAGGDTLSDTVHIILGAIDSALFVLSIAIGASAAGRRFRTYSIVTIVAVLVAGSLTFLASPGVADNESTPWIGITERVAVFGSMLWISSLSLALWRRPHQAER